MTTTTHFPLSSDALRSVIQTLTHFTYYGIEHQERAIEYLIYDRLEKKVTPATLRAYIESKTANSNRIFYNKMQLVAFLLKEFSADLRREYPTVADPFPRRRSSDVDA